MITTLKEDDYVYAYIEWNLVDSAGRTENNGPYIYIGNIWIHPKYRRTRAFKKIIKKLDEHPMSQGKEFVYWEIVRDKNSIKIIDDEERAWSQRRTSHLYPRDYITNKIFRGELKCI